MFVMECSIDDNWTTTVLFSRRPYDHKPTDPECRAMKFDSTVAGMGLLSEKICEGYSFCPTNRRKSEVSEGNMIVIDIDGAGVPMEDFVGNLPYTPSIYYTTFSNSDKDRDYRFRLIYAIDGYTSGVNSYNAVFDYIVSVNRMGETLPEKAVDKRQANQMYHGSHNCHITSTGLVYKVPPVLLVNTDTEDKRERGNHLSGQMSKRFLRYNRIGSFLSDYEYENGEPGVITETPYIPSEEVEGMLVPAGDYMVVPRRYGWFDRRTKKKVFVKWKDGQNRHGKLWLAGLIMRRLNPHLSEDELFYGYVKYIYANIDLFNSDRSLKYSKEKIMDEFNSVMDVDLSLFAVKSEVKHSGFRVDSLYCVRKGISKREAVCEINRVVRSGMKEMKYEMINELYNPDVKRTRKEWVKFLSENGIEVSIPTFDRFLNEYGYSKSKTK